MSFSGKKKIMSIISYWKRLVLKEATLQNVLSRSPTSQPKLKKSYNNFFLKKKRASLLAFRLKAVLSIEASVVLVLFTIAILSIISFGTVMNLKMQIEPALKNTCSKIAQDYALYDSLTLDSDELIKKFAVKGIGISSARAMLINELGKDKLDESCIVNGSSGISFIYSEITDNQGYVDLVISYKVKLPFQIIPFPSLNMIQRSRIYPWKGYVVFGSDSDSKEYVYVTENGSVYHVSLNCRHLNLKIREIDSDTLVNARNENGGKYYECKLCYPDLTGDVIYITKNGTAYHGKKDCPALTRNVKKVLKSEVLGLPACKNCGGY